MSVEKFWNRFERLVPQHTSRISLRLFNIYSRLVFLKFNAQMYQAGKIPAWAHKDSQLMMQLDVVEAALRTMCGDQAAVQPLCDPFAPADS